MKYGIVVDSSCDMKSLKAEAMKQIDFTKVALKLDIGDKEFVDDCNLNIEEFMEEMYAYKGKTGSAAPSPQDWFAAYEKSEYVFALTITGALSGSYASAKTALDMFKEEYPDRKIHLIDSKSTGPEMTLIAHKLTEYMELGMDFEEICTQIDTYVQSTHLLFILTSLENLIKNGRVSKLQGSIAGILGIKMLGIASTEGTLELLKKCRGKMTAYDKAIEEMLSRGYNGGKVVISHYIAPATAAYIEEKVKERYPDSSVEIMPTGGLCSYYAERGGILIGFETN